MNLVVDIGNATVKMAVMDQSNNIVKFYREKEISTENISGIISLYKIDASIWISTRKIDSDVENFLSSMTPVSVRFRYGITDLPIKVGYDDPQKLGADRLALAIGVWKRLPFKNTLIFDFGTALTVDFLSNQGIFTGGCISPGLGLRLLSLHEHTGALPLVDPIESLDLQQNFPTNTQDAISQGVYRSMLYEIAGYINSNKQAEVVFSGYDAKYFVDKFKITIFAKYDVLLFEGLNEVLKAVNV